jgi:hypothetical protein
MSSWDEFCGQRRRAIERFVNGDTGPYKQLWSHADDVTISGMGSMRARLGRRQQASGLGGQSFRGGARRHRQPRGRLER